MHGELTLKKKVGEETKQINRTPLLLASTFNPIKKKIARKLLFRTVDKIYNERN
jgi:hypothetical protein